MAVRKIKYPIGDQDFKSIREGGFLYIDKTPYLEKIIDANKYLFLARPRRFGKSLFLSTIKYFFEGRRDLFKNLYIDSIDWEWKKYPVLHLDLNTDKYTDRNGLHALLDNIFRQWESQYSVEAKDENLSQRFKTIIRHAHQATGLPVVILVDEYDKPLVGNQNTPEIFDYYRNQLASLYSNFKSSAEHIRLVFFTGVSRFSKLSIFSDLNNLDDISFDNDYAAICGITARELQESLHSGIAALAGEYEVSHDEICKMLKDFYDGYRFAKRECEIYNPWSLLNAISKRDIRNYWSLTGKPTIIAEALRHVNANLEEVMTTRCSFRTLSGLDLQSPNPVALLYQTGYITIKHYERATDVVTLGVPNTEVRESLFDELLPFYLSLHRDQAKGIIFNIVEAVKMGNPREMIRQLDAYFAAIPYDLKMENENNLQNALYILTTLIGIDTKAEVHTSYGRIDLLIETPDFIYVIELKYDSSSERALKQIEDKQYMHKFLTDPRTLFRIGANFSSKTRRLEASILPAD